MARITMREAISQALWEEMERDPNVFILGEEVGFGAEPMRSPKVFTIILARNGCGILPSPKLPSSVQRSAQR